MHSTGHTSKRVMKMCSHLLWEAASTFYTFWIGGKKKGFSVCLHFSKMESQWRSGCVLPTRWKASIKYDPNQSYSDMLRIAFLSQMNRQRHVVLKQY